MTEIQHVTDTREEQEQSLRRFDRFGLVACIAISIFTIAWITLASSHFNLGAVAFLLVLPWVLLRAGAIVTSVLRFPSFFALDFLLGVALVSTAVMAWKLFVPLSLWVLMPVLLLAVAVIPLVIIRQERPPLSGLGLLAILVSLVAATGWSQDLIVPTRAVEGGVIFKPWLDFFYHSTVIAQSLGAETLSQVGHYEWKGFPAYFYHHASYSIPLCLAKASSLRAYDTVVGFWAPFGAFLTALASYALGRAIWNHAAGLAALVAVFLLPDAWMLNVAHPTYGYYWLLEVSPANFYGIAIAGTALILIALGVREARRAWITAGVVLAVFVVFFKIQLCAAAFPLLVSFAIIGWPPRRWWQWLVLAGCVACGLVILPVIDRLYVGPNFQLDLSGSPWFWKVMAMLAKGTRVQGWYEVFRVDHPFPEYLPRAIMLLLVNTLGIFIVITPILWAVVLWGKKWTAYEATSLAALVILSLMTFTLGGSGPSSNAHEFMHRPFVWAYWLVGSLTAGRLFSIFTKSRPRLWTNTIAVAAIALTLVPICYGSGLQRGKSAGAKSDPTAPVFSFAAKNSSVRVDRGLVDCAEYIRSRPPYNAVIEDSQLDKSLTLAGLAERPSFAARVEGWTRQSKKFRQSYRQQLGKLGKMQHATNIQDLQQSVRETGIRWYVTHPGDPNVWPAEFRDQPAFESNGYRVYDMQRAFELHG
jgi:hypothetical protein